MRGWFGASVFNCLPSGFTGITDTKLSCCLTKTVPGLEVGRAPVKEKTPRWVCSENTSVSEPCIQTPTMVRPLLHNVEPGFLIILFFVNSFSVLMIDSHDVSPKCSPDHFWGLRFLWSQKGISMLVPEQMPALKRDMNAGGIQVCLSWLCSIIQTLRLGSWAGWRRSWACPWKRSRCDSVKQTVVLASLPLENGTHSLPASFGRHL